MGKFWDVKVRKSIKKEFPNDLMMQELHELRARSPFSLEKAVEVRKALTQELEKLGLKFLSC